MIMDNFCFQVYAFPFFHGPWYLDKNEQSVESRPEENECLWPHISDSPLSENSEMKRKVPISN